MINSTLSKKKKWLIQQVIPHRYSNAIINLSTVIYNIIKSKNSKKCKIHLDFDDRVDPIP